MSRLGSESHIEPHGQKSSTTSQPLHWSLQEKMKTSQKQLDELTKRVSMLMAEKSQLETRNRWADQVLGVLL